MSILLGERRQPEDGLPRIRQPALLAGHKTWTGASPSGHALAVPDTSCFGAQNPRGCCGCGDIMEYLVIGAGPAGLQLSYLLARSGRDFHTVEAGERPGSFFTAFPRHRRLISINKRYTGSQDPEINLRMDWNSLLSE